MHKGLNNAKFHRVYGFVREIWTAVREKSGKCQGILFCPICMNPAWADQLLPQLLMENLILCLYNVDTLNICMKEFGSEKNNF